MPKTGPNRTDFTPNKGKDCNMDHVVVSRLCYAPTILLDMRIMWPGN